jgi:hypothetical protein
MKRILGAALALFTSITFAATTVPVQLLNPAGSTAGQTILSTGPSTAPAWGGIALSGLGAQAANTVVANATGSSATPTAAPLPSCSTTNSALKYTSGTGFGCGSTFATTGANTFTAQQSVNTSGSTQSIAITDSGTNGANIRLVGNGSTTPSKTIRAANGTLNIVNDAYSAVILNLTDAGALTVTGNISAAGGSFSVRPTFNGATPWDSANLNFAAPPAIGGTTPAAGAFTSLSATGTITGSTLVSTGNMQGPAAGYSISTVTGVSSGGGIQIFDGTHGNNVSITNAGSPVASFNGSGVTFANTAGIVGVTGASTALAGTVGEHACQTGSGVSLTSGTLTNITSVSLAAGEYQIGGNIAFNPAAGTTMTLTSGSTSTTSATNGALTNSLNLSFPTGLGQSYALAQQFYKFTATTTVFLVAASTFSGGTNSGTGTLCWLRIR